MLRPKYKSITKLIACIHLNTDAFTQHKSELIEHKIWIHGLQEFVFIYSLGPRFSESWVLAVATELLLSWFCDACPRLPSP